MKTLRTPDESFRNLSGYPFTPCYTDVPDGDGGSLRIHHVAEGIADGDLILCMHGQPTWSYLYRHMIPIFAEAGMRVVAPDLVGYGRSDKPAAREDYTYQRQVDWMTAWLVANDLRDVTLVCQDWGGLIGLRLAAENPERFSRIVIANTGLPVPQNVPQERIDEYRKFRSDAPTPDLVEMATALSNPDPEHPELTFAHWQKFCWETEDMPLGMMVTSMIDGRALSPEETAAYDAPFPDPSYKMGPRAMPSQVPLLPDDPSVAANLEAWKVLAAWDRPFLCAFTDNDPVTSGADAIFKERVPGAQGLGHTTIRGGGHFLQEGRAAELAALVLKLVQAG